MGRLVCVEEDGLYVEGVLEIDASGEVVWEWWMSNHLCAGCDEPTRVDVNSGSGHDKADWVHANSLVYDAEHDVLLLGGAYTSEVYIIDHSAPRERPLLVVEGGVASGSLLYRWGSGRLGEQHDVRVTGCAAGASSSVCFSVFNNGRYRSAGACAFGPDGAQTTSCSGYAYS